MKNAYNTSAYGSFAYVYDIFMDQIIKSRNCCSASDPPALAQLRDFRYKPS